MERLNKMLCKIRSVMRSRTSFLVVCLLALFSSFFVSLLTPSPANAYLFLDRYGEALLSRVVVKTNLGDRTLNIVSDGYAYGDFAGNYSDVHDVCITMNTYLPQNSYFNLTISMQPNFIGKVGGVTGSSSVEILDVDSTYNGEVSTFNITGISRANNSNYMCLGFRTMPYASLPNGFTMTVSPVSWGNILTGTQIPVDIAEIKSILKEMNTTLKGLDLGQVTGAIKDAQNQAHQDANNQIDATNKTTNAINNQAKQEQDRYDKDKQEEADREQQGSQDANNLGGIFNITLLNPFAGIWELLNSGGCTSIPTLASWLGSDQTTYCSWWPQSIRATLTPVFSLASMMVLFGFVVRWLGGSEGFDVKVSGLSKGVK